MQPLPLPTPAAPVFRALGTLMLVHGEPESVDGLRDALAGSGLERSRILAPQIDQAFEIAFQDGSWIARPARERIFRREHAVGAAQRNQPFVVRHAALLGRQGARRPQIVIARRPDHAREARRQHVERELQMLGAFDLKTSSWLATPPAIRALGGALFGDRRYDTVFTYHNGAESYYAARGFRGLLRV